MLRRTNVSWPQVHNDPEHRRLRAREAPANFNEIMILVAAFGLWKRDDGGRNEGSTNIQLY